MLVSLGHALGYGLVTASVTIMASMGITLQFSVTNYINFAYGTVLTVAMFVTYALWSIGSGFWLAAIGGVVAAMLLSLTIGRLLQSWFVRRGAPHLIILVATFGLYMIIENVVLAIWGPSYRSLPIAGTVAQSVGPFLLTTLDEEIIVAAAVVTAAAFVLLRRTSLGRQLRAISDSSQLAASSGINVNRVTDLAWVISGGLAGIAGIALAADIGTFNPGSTDAFLFLFFAAVVLGGVGDVFGAFVGGLLLGLAVEVAALFVNPAYKYMIAIIVLIVLALVRPVGIFGRGKVTMSEG